MSRRPRLGGCWDKWENGKAHLETYQREYRALVPPGEEYFVPFEYDVEEATDDYAIVVYKSGTLPDISNRKFGLIIGDVLTNFRAALDHLAWVMVRKRGTPLGQLDRRQKLQVAFPLARSRKTFPGTFSRNLPGIDRTSPLGQLVESYQPYQRGKAAEALRALRVEGDRDKHRLLIPTFWFPQGMKIEVFPKGAWIVDPELLVDNSRRRPYKSGTPLFRCKIIRHPDVAQPKVELKGNLTMNPTIGSRWWVVNILKSIQDTVEEVLMRFGKEMGL